MREARRDVEDVPRPERDVEHARQVALVQNVSPFAAREGVRARFEGRVRRREDAPPLRAGALHDEDLLAVRVRRRGLRHLIPRQVDVQPHGLLEGVERRAAGAAEQRRKRHAAVIQKDARARRRRAQAPARPGGVVERDVRPAPGRAVGHARRVVQRRRVRVDGCCQSVERERVGRRYSFEHARRAPPRVANFGPGGEVLPEVLPGRIGGA
mmetsp:Transcript_17143/g.45082  ORF Transcript_17143/g.45082 Transcript_17143/m.45082 type:complete len:211 (-) Transcript_17143:163-795(-)